MAPHFLYRRREFITGVGAAAVASPLVARAQQAMPVIGFLGSRESSDDPHYLTAFRRGLNESGFVEGQNVAIEYRWAENRYERLPALAADLVHEMLTMPSAPPPGWIRWHQDSR